MFATAASMTSGGQPQRICMRRASIRTESRKFQRFDGEHSHLHDLVLEMGGTVHQQLKEDLEAFKIKGDTIDVGFAVSLAWVAKARKRLTHHAQNLVEYAIIEREGVDLRLN